MKRFLAVAITALFCTGCQGCQSQRQPVDPFLGRTTVPPPPTGVIGPAGSVPPDSGGFLQRAPATSPATNNQFAPPESNNDLFPPPGINNGLPVGAYPGYQSSAPPPQNTRWARANPNRATSAPPAAGSAALASQPTSTGIPITAIQPSAALNPPAATGNSGNIQLTSGSQPWQSAQTDTTAPSAATADSLPTNQLPTNQIRIMPSSSSSGSASGSSDPTDIMNLPPKSSSTVGTPATM